MDDGMDTPDTPQPPPVEAMFQPFPTPVMTNGQILKGADGEIWVVVSIITPNGVMHLMMSPEDCVRQGEEISKIGIRGRQAKRDALIQPTKPRLVLPTN